MAIDPLVTEAIKNTYYVSIHQINKAKYDSMIKAYFGANPPASHTVAVANLDADNEDPSSRRLNLQFDPSADNNVIISFFADIPRHDELITVNYSVQFLRGLNIVYPGVGRQFHFSKAMDDENNPTVVLKLVDTMGKPMYYGDLTNMFP